LLEPEAGDAGQVIEDIGWQENGSEKRENGKAEWQEGDFQI